MEHMRQALIASCPLREPALFLSLFRSFKVKMASMAITSGDGESYREETGDGSVRRRPGTFRPFDIILR
jgi:hypothetical protein